MATEVQPETFKATYHRRLYRGLEQPFHLNALNVYRRWNVVNRLSALSVIADGALIDYLRMMLKPYVCRVSWRIWMPHHIPRGIIGTMKIHISDTRLAISHQKTRGRRLKNGRSGA